MTSQQISRGTVVITGATGMLGSATARHLAGQSIDTVLVARNAERGAHLVDELTSIDASPELVVADLSEPESVRSAAATIRSRHARLAGLLHSAALLTPERRTNSAGQEVMFATNVLARLLLTHELSAPLTAGNGRVVWATGPSPDRLDLDDLMAADGPWSAFRQLRATNAANLQLAFELARRGAGSGITSNAFHPGALQSQLMAQMPLPVRILTAPFGRTAGKAAAALADLLTSPDHATTTGAFRKLGKPAATPKASLDTSSQQRLWTVAALLVGIDTGATI